MKALMNDSKIWQWSLLCFLLAGVAGFMYRLGFVVPLPIDLNLENVRHAHSHLMFFGWASLLPLFFIKLEIVSGYHAAWGVRIMKYGLWSILTFGLLAFPFFMLWGYRSVPVGNSELPLSVIFSGLVMIGWYIFMLGYFITRKRKPDFETNIWFEGAMVMLFISSLGAWGVGFLQMTQLGPPLFGKALTHFFLATFVEGWVILVLLGMIAKVLKLEEEDYVVPPLVLVGLIAFGAPLTFPYGITESMVSLSLSVAARMGGVLVAEGVILFVYSAIKKRKMKTGIWIWPMLFLLLKAIMQLIAAVSPAGLWLSEHGIRILYLHVLLLGAFSIGAFAYLMEGLNIARSYFYLILFAVSALILSLLFMTSFWPESLSGVWIYSAMAIVATIPIFAAAIVWAKLFMMNRKRQNL